MGEDCLVDIVEHDVGNEQREGAALRHAYLLVLFGTAVEEFVDPTELIGVSVFGIMKATTYFRKNFVALTGLQQGMGMEIVAGEVG